MGGDVADARDRGITYLILGLVSVNYGTVVSRASACSNSVADLSTAVSGRDLFSQWLND